MPFFPPSWGTGSAPPATVYTSMEDISEVSTYEEGWYFTPNLAVTFPGLVGQNGIVSSSLAAWIQITTIISNNYSGITDLPPEHPNADGALVQVAKVTDGYGIPHSFYRYRYWGEFETGVFSWSTWSSWTVAPMPIKRPSIRGVWGSGPVWGDDLFLPLLHPTATSASEAKMDSVASQFSTLFADASKVGVEGGHLQMKSASASFEGILDGTLTPFGTQAFVGRSNNYYGRTGRLEWTPAASAADAVSGFHLPIPPGARHTPGMVLHATFMVTGGITTATRLLAGICHTSAVASVMSDVDPSTLATTSVVGAGYGRDDANYGIFGNGGPMDSGIPVATSNQRVDLKIFSAPSTSTADVLLTVSSNSGLTASKFRAESRIPINADLSLFLRASAGGTSAQPKVALTRLRFSQGGIAGL